MKMNTTLFAINLLYIVFRGGRDDRLEKENGWLDPKGEIINDYRFLVARRDCIWK